MGEIRQLTGLRAIAAFYVFMFHMVIRGVLPYILGSIKSILGQGVLGVNVFFVLSEFLLAYSHIKDFELGYIPSVKYYSYFIFKRFARIYPVYLMGLLLTLIGSFVLNNIPANFPLIFMLNATMLQSWIPPLAMKWYGGGSWSVSTELFFYLTFPVILPLLLRINTMRSLFVLLVIIILLAATPGILYNFAFEKPEATGFLFTYPFPPARLAEFVAGIITALLVLRFGWKVSAGVMIGLLVLTTLYLAKLGYRMDGYVAHNLVVLPVIVCSVACLAYGPQTILLRWLGSAWMGYLGRISYSFYIMQLAILVTLDTVWARGLLPQDAIWVMPLVLLLNLLSAVIMYEVVEKRMHKQLLRQFVTQKFEVKYL